MFERVDEVGDVRKRISVLDSMRIYISIILAGTECSVLLWHKKEEGCLRGLGWEDLPFLEILIYECFQCFQFLGVE